MHGWMDGVGLVIDTDEDRWVGGVECLLRTGNMRADDRLIWSYEQNAYV